MKALCLLLVCALGLLAGCRPASKPVKQEVEDPSSTAGNPLLAPVEYGGAVVKAKKSITKTVDVANVANAIKLFHAQEDRYPATLQELISSGMLRELPRLPSGLKYDYNAKSGVVRAVPQ